MGHLSNLNQPESIISAASSQKEAINLCEFLARRDFCFLSGGKTQKTLTNIAGNLLESWLNFKKVGIALSETITCVMEERIDFVVTLLLVPCRRAVMLTLRQHAPIFRAWTTIL
ncbi:MAG: hypothetical protein WDN30_03770 [Pararobbsia sp.]